MSLLERVHATLDQRKIPHAAIGAVALAVHGVARSTLDVDLLVRTVACLDRATWAGLASEGVSVDVRRGDAEDPLAGVVGLAVGGEPPIDVIVGRAAWQDGVIVRAEPAQVAGVNLPVALPADLVLLKLYAGGAQDRWDVEQLLATIGGAAVVAAVDREIGALPPRCRALWRDLRGEPA